MPQSYGNSSTSPIQAATDEIMGVIKTTQKIGTTLSGAEPAAVAAAQTLTYQLDENAMDSTITFAAALSDMWAIAQEIQDQVRAETTPDAGAPQSAFDNFTARYDSALDRLVLQSGTAPASTSAVRITGGTAAPALNLGPANGGLESYTGNEIVDYTFRYRFVYGAGASFGSADVKVSGVALTISAAETTATSKASQLKAELSQTVSTSASDNSENGPVVL